MRRAQADVVVMESTGIYWKSPHAALEKAGLSCQVVNAQHVKNVPGRKTDVCDAEWLAALARAGLLKSSFVAPEKLRRLRFVSRQRQKLVGMLAAEKNRLAKVLATPASGWRRGQRHHGSLARLIAALIAGATPEQALEHASGRLKAPRAEIADALDGDISEKSGSCLSDPHPRRLVAGKVREFDDHLIAKLDRCEEKNALALLQTIRHRSDRGGDAPG